MKKWIFRVTLAAAVLVILGAGGFAYLALVRVEGAYFDSGGVRIHYTDEGAGAPVVLVHGFAANADLNWRRAGVTRMLAREFRVISPDLRGHGLSGKPLEPEAYGIELVEDLRRLLDHLDIEQAHIAGYSLGGIIGLKFAAEHPGRVASLAVCGAGWRDPEDDSDLPKPYSRPRVELPEHFRAAVIPLSAGRPLAHRIRSWVGEHVNDFDALRACRKTWDALLAPPDAVEAIAAPVACIIGTEDGLLEMALLLHERFPETRLVLLPGANHLTTPMRRDFRRELRAFLREHAGQP